jgi:hypothetical protein
MVLLIYLLLQSPMYSLRYLPISSHFQNSLLSADNTHDVKDVSIV